MKNGLRIETLGTSITISANEDPVYLRELLDYYLAAVEKTGKTYQLADPLKVAILTGFLLCDDLKKHPKDQFPDQDAQESSAVQDLALSMIARIDEVLEYDT